MWIMNLKKSLQIFDQNQSIPKPEYTIATSVWSSFQNSDNSFSSINL